jgi:hypothetical protein
MHSPKDFDSSADPLWELLGNVSPTPTPGNLADNVLRRIRSEETSAPTIRLSDWLANSWKRLTGLTASAAVLVALFFFRGLPTTEPTRADAGHSAPLFASISPGAMTDLGDMDTALDDNDIWLGTDSY